MSTLITEETFQLETDSVVKQPFALLKPVNNTMPTVGQIHVGDSWGSIKSLYIKEWAKAPHLGFDFETNGLPIWHKEFMVVGVGIAWGTRKLPRSCYISFKGEDGRARGYTQYIQGLIKLDKPLIAHNMFYDGTILARYNKGILPPQAKWCTYAMSKHLASERFKGQQWGLKWMMKHCLGWADSNETKLMQWLVDNGHTTTAQAPQPESTAGWFFRSSDNKWCRPNKGQMWQAPDSILGHYCMQDSLGTLELYEDVFTPLFKLFPEYLAYYEGPFWRMLRRLSESHLQGIGCDKKAMGELYVSLEKKIDMLERAFLTTPIVAKHIAIYNGRIIDAKDAKEPSQVTKKGDISGTWRNWWRSRQSLATANHFNIGSDKQLSWLFYEQLKMATPTTPKTDSGDLSVGDSALHLLGPLGLMIREHRESIKLQGYVNAYLEEHIDGDVVHPGWNVPGTLTGRLSGQSPNFQQAPKNKGFLDCFKPPPGRVWVDNDLRSLENVIAAEITDDPILNKVYEPGSEACAHCETAARFPGLGDTVRKFYNPEAPTNAMVKALKKAHKWLRDLGKKVNYSQVYGIGARKLHTDLELEGVVVDGVPISFEQAQAMWQSYWDTYEGLARYKDGLMREWSMRDGWIRNAIGRPCPVSSDRIKDLFSQAVQSGGHDILLLYVDCVEEALNEAGIKDWRFVIPDFHDETIVECNEEDGQVVAKLMETVAYDKLQDILGARIKHSGDSCIGKTLSPFKLED